LIVVLGKPCRCFPGGLGWSTIKESLTGRHPLRVILIRPHLLLGLRRVIARSCSSNGGLLLQITKRTLFLGVYSGAVVRLLRSETPPRMLRVQAHLYLRCRWRLSLPIILAELYQQHQVPRTFEYKWSSSETEVLLAYLDVTHVSHDDLHFNLSLLTYGRSTPLCTDYSYPS
jgi:hypothetical protein